MCKVLISKFETSDLKVNEGRINGADAVLMELKDKHESGRRLEAGGGRVCGITASSGGDASKFLPHPHQFDGACPAACLCLSVASFYRFFTVGILEMTQQKYKTELTGYFQAHSAATSADTDEMRSV